MDIELKNQFFIPCTRWIRGLRNMSRIRTNIITNRMVDGAPVASTGLRVTGVCTATSFSGDGSNLTGVSGFATALSSDQSSLLNQVFKTNREASISSGTVSIQSDAASGNMAFTRLNRINVTGSAVLHVGAGTTFKMNVLDLF